MNISCPLFISPSLDAIVEQQMPMTAANMFWLDTLHDCNLDQSLPLPYDRYRLFDEHRTSHGTSVSFDFSQHLSHHFLSYASLNNINPQHLSLALYYAFLFKLTNGERDLCVGMNVNNRYKDELKSIIGLFENIIPLRCQLDSDWSFHRVTEHVCNIVTSSMTYSYFPLQRLLAQHSHALKPIFLDIFFEYRSSGSNNENNEVMIGGTRLHPLSILVNRNEDESLSKFDFHLMIQHDLDLDQLSYTINASLDLFDVKTIHKVAQRFHSMLEQLFQTTDVEMKKPIYEISLTLSDERLLMRSMNNTQVLFPSLTCIHHEFISQVMEHPQKLALELDEQSLTYVELLHYVQMLSLNLLNNHHIVVGEIVCQCVERSISMVS
jgi:non-ribosomal peptide synthetase component F